MVFSPQKSETWIRIDISERRLFLYKGPHQVLKTFPVAIGKGKGSEKKTREDLITPRGVFRIWRVVDSSKWVFDPAWFNESGKPVKGAYGKYCISFYNPWGIAIHGTNNEASVGRKVTHGCIRMKNRDIAFLIHFVKPGMKLVIDD